MPMGICSLSGMIPSRELKLKLYVSCPTWMWQGWTFPRLWWMSNWLKWSLLPLRHRIWRMQWWIIRHLKLKKTTNMKFKFVNIFFVGHLWWCAPLYPWTIFCFPIKCLGLLKVIFLLMLSIIPLFVFKNIDCFDHPCHVIVYLSPRLQSLAINSSYLN